MIHLNEGMPMDPKSLPDEQRAIYEALNNSPMDYDFPSKDQLKFEITMRTHILQNARKIDEGDSEFSAFADSRFNPAFWIKTPYGYELRRGRLPSDAIRDVFTNSALYSFECVTTIVLIYYKSILDSIEPSIFNDLYSHLFIWGSNYNENLWMETYRGVDRIPGDVYYFYNPDYADPIWMGENSVYMADDLYFGHGIGMVSHKKMIEALDTLRIEGAKKSAYLLNQVTRLNSARFYPYRR
ncbi:protein-glutamine gamma-glutamyltransferase [Rossellomorea marisflavi]|nr:protein-glutamine gamma-glutamyltransferase [Rossellomorea marisflavi]MCM2589420.1 protein-glutamine gamma-glutamyltransferase [Rossellomorea marisflavi]MDR4936167.1 protein-glutamine gamma-glutamyltransferase [Rossellomorea marisflavi]VXB85578.1 conserved hypothetical protein [Bacillus sp. 349Y]